MKLLIQRGNKLSCFLLFLLIVVTVGIQLWFGFRKAGFHEDEYYSYYSTNMTYGWNVPNGEWVDMQHYRNEFAVVPGEGFQYGKVTTVQSWDVHPPFYYWILHTVCSLTPNVFSKWQGIGINMAAFAVAMICLYATGNLLFQDRWKTYGSLAVCLCYAVSPATVSSAMFVRMYALLSAMILFSVYIHTKAWLQDRMTDPRFLFPLILSVYTGFLTHYYFLLFQFFLTAATCIALLIRKRRWRYSIIYGATVLFSLALAYLTYPACLGQMFRGQRGAEATANMFDLSTLFVRIRFFGDLMNRYLFGGTFWVILALFVLCLVCFIVKWSAKRRACGGDVIWGIILFLTSAGYLLTVSKSALMLGDSSLRYIQPIFGVVLLLFFLFLRLLAEDCFGRRVGFYVEVVSLVLLTALGVTGLVRGKVLFLFPEDRQKIAYAQAHENIPAVYLYKKESAWCVWESADELFVYPEMYFADAGQADSIRDERINNASELIVYINNFGDTEKQIKRILRSNDSLNHYEMICESKFCTLYYFAKQPRG